MKRSIGIFLFVLFVTTLSVAPSFVASAEDLCKEAGIIVRNATMLDLWYKKNGGACSIWIHEHLFTIKPGDSIEIFSDLGCKTLYCGKNPTYRDYKSLDTNGNCGVRILPACKLSDM